MVIIQAPTLHKAPIGTSLRVLKGFGECLLLFGGNPPPLREPKPSATGSLLGLYSKLSFLILIRCSFLKQKCKTVASRDTVYEAKDVPGVF